MRSPSGSAPGSIRGARPGRHQHHVRVELAVAATATVRGPVSRPAAGQDLDALGGQPGGDVRGLRLGQRLDPRVDPRRVHGRERRAIGRVGPQPRAEASCSAAIMSAVAISVLDGTQSVSTQAPPSPSRSTTVTSAPSCAATRAAS